MFTGEAIIRSWHKPSPVLVIALQYLHRNIHLSAGWTSERTRKLHVMMSRWEKQLINAERSHFKLFIFWTNHQWLRVAFMSKSLLCAIWLGQISAINKHRKYIGHSAALTVFCCHHDLHQEPSWDKIIGEKAAVSADFRNLTWDVVASLKRP